MTQLATPPVIDPELCPGYRLCRFLGRGGFGQVWEAEAADGTHVALKFLRCTGPQAAVQELRSIQVVRQLHHPHLVGIDRVWSARDHLVVAMELADGSLLDLLGVYREELGGPIPAGDLLPFLAQAAEAVDFLNECQHLVNGRRVGIQHCDINPRNILLFGEAVKLSDFGLTTVLGCPNAAHRRAGTPDYAAPEVFQGRLSDRTDQYALAVSYCLLRGGRLPFPDTPGKLKADYVRPVPDLAMLPEPERSAIARALARLPQDRWPSCRQLVAELSKTEAPAAPRPVAARPGERRGGRRYPASPWTCCRLLGAGGGAARTEVQDVSTGGIRVLLSGPDCAFERGKSVSVVLTNRARGCARVLRARVAYRRSGPGGAWVLGCAFDEGLTNDDVRRLAGDMAEPPAAAVPVVPAGGA